MLFMNVPPGPASHASDPLRSTATNSSRRLLPWKLPDATARRLRSAYEPSAIGRRRIRRKIREILKFFKDQFAAIVAKECTSRFARF
jgi:hypothetical protein